MVPRPISSTRVSFFNALTTSNWLPGPFQHRIVSNTSGFCGVDVGLALSVAVGAKVFVAFAAKSDVEDGSGTGTSIAVSVAATQVATRSGASSSGEDRLQETKTITRSRLDVTKEICVRIVSLNRKPLSAIKVFLNNINFNARSFGLLVLPLYQIP